MVNNEMSSRDKALHLLQDVTDNVRDVQRKKDAYRIKEMKVQGEVKTEQRVYARERSSIATKANRLLRATYPRDPLHST